MHCRFFRDTKPARGKHRGAGGLTASTCLLLFCLVFPVVQATGLAAMQPPGAASQASRVTCFPLEQTTANEAHISLLIVSLLLLCTAAVFLVRMRVRHRIEVEKGRMGIVIEERSRIASECHDSLMAGFAAVSWQLEATAKLFRDSDLAGTPAAESCELARSMVLLCQAEARRIIWDLRDTEELTSSLSRSLTRMLERNYSQGRVLPCFRFAGAETELSPGCVHHLTRIAQEAVSNAVRHAAAGTIELSLEYENSSLHLRVRDDGCGFHAHDQEQSRLGHFGLAVMQERARKLGGTLHVQSGRAGTEVWVTVPFDSIAPTAPTHEPQGSRIDEEVVQWIGL